MNSGGVSVSQAAELRLRAAHERCAQRAEATRTVQFLAVRQAVAPCDPLRAFAQSEHRQRGFWEHPATGYALAALGSVWQPPVGDSEQDDRGQQNRFAAASQCAQQLFESVTVVGSDDESESAGPLLMAGFSFSDRHGDAGEWQGFTRAQLVLPEILVVRAAGRSFVTSCHRIEPGTDREASWNALQGVLASALRQAAATGGVLGDLVGTSPLSSQPPFAAGAEYRVVADREHTLYRRQVRDALAAIDDGLLEKVVLARSLRVEHPGRFAVPALLDRLRQLYPECVTYACAQAETTFVCASPERLVSLAGECVSTGALAGSAARGCTPEEDVRLGDELKRSPKERAEHQAVVRAIHHALRDICWPLRGPAEPELMRLQGIQHLHTPLSGRILGARVASFAGAGDRVNGGCAAHTVLDLVGRLHPTPAVGGLPTTAALEWIEQREGLQRGWFGGPVGFIDRRGGGEFRVALRAGLIRNPPLAGASVTDTGPAFARLYAGAGVVKGSCPEQELRETRLKLRALLAPLTEI